MTTALARRITEAHRLGQVRIGAQTVQLMGSSFPILDPTDVEGTLEPWLRTAVPIVQRQRTISAELAARYLVAIRSASLGFVDSFVPAPVAEVPAKQVITSLLVTGPYALRGRLARGLDVARAVDMSLAGSAGAAMRLALQGGRQTITSNIQRDHRAVGYERVTSGSPCDFCSMLADRGAVYGEESGDFEAHDHCSCSAEPVYE